ncbi:UDP-N-acetylenolpyruvoylglucosamine reductase, partial [Bifidobacteriaceae bacterium WP022]
TNRNNASCDDIANLAKTIIRGVQSKFGVTLIPEPVVINISIN